MAANTVLVSGIGRSGTGYVATVLQACGLRAAHKRVFRGGIVRPPDPRRLNGLDVEVSGFAAGHLHERAFRQLPVVQVVRHPLDWLASWLTLRYTIDYINRHLFTDYPQRTDWATTMPGTEPIACPSILHENYGQELEIWTRWNQLVSVRACFFFQVERMGSDEVRAIAQLAGKRAQQRLREPVDKAMLHVPRLVNSTRAPAPHCVWRQHEHLDWEDIPDSHGKILARRLGRRYGYR